MRFVLQSVVVAAGVLAASSARANGYLAARFGSDHGTPAMPNAYAVYYNPGALGGTEKTTIVVDGTFVLRTASYTRSSEALSPTSESTKSNRDYFLANTGKAKLTNFLVLPYLGVSSDLGTKDFRVGYAFYVPYGGSSTWDKKDEWSGHPTAPGAVDGPQRWHNISGQLQMIYNTVAVAYRIAPARLSIGASFSVIYSSVKTVRARNASGFDDVTGANGSLLEGRSLLEASGVQLGIAAGLYWEPLADRSLKIGVSYTSQPGLGKQRLKGTLDQQFGTTAPRAPATDVDFLQEFPDLIRLGVAYRVAPKIELRADGYMIRWSKFKDQCIVTSDGDCNVQPNGAAGSQVVGNIPRNWRDAFGGRAGVGVFVNDAVEVFGSLAMTSSPVPKATMDASTMDSTRFYVTLGGRFKVTDNLAIAGSANYIWFAPVDTAGQSTLDTYQPPSRVPSADGTYRQAIFFLNANVAYTF